MPCTVLSAPRLSTDVVLAQDAASGENERELAGSSFGRRDILRDDKASLASNKRVDVHDGRAFRGLGIARPLDAAEAFQPFVAHASEGGSQCSDLVHDLGRMLIVHGVAQGFGQLDGDLPIGVTSEWGHYLPHPRDAAFGIREGAVLLEERGTGQQHMGEFGSFVQEDVLNDQTFHRTQGPRDVLGVRI